jgi:hypothetical protein
MEEPWTTTDSQDSPWPGLGRNHHLPPYSRLCACPRDEHSNVILSQDFVSGWELNPIGFDPYNCSMKIQEFTRTLTPKVGAHLGVWRFIPSHFLALPRAWNVTPELFTWLAPLQALVLVASPRLRLRQGRSRTFTSFILWIDEISLQMHLSKKPNELSCWNEHLKWELSFK